MKSWGGGCLSPALATLVVATSLSVSGGPEGDSPPEVTLFWRLAQHFRFSPESIRISPSGHLLLWGQVDTSTTFSYSIDDGAVGITSDILFLDRSGELYSSESSVRFIRANILDDLPLEDASIEFFGTLASLTGIGVAVRLGWKAVLKEITQEVLEEVVPMTGLIPLSRRGLIYYKNMKYADDLTEGLRTFSKTTILEARSVRKLENGHYNYVYEWTERGFELRVGPKSVNHSQLATHLHSDKVVGAGTLEVRDGEVVLITNVSGHYWPKADSLELVSRHLDAQRISASDLAVVPYRSIEDWQQFARQNRP